MSAVDRLREELRPIVDGAASSIELEPDEAEELLEELDDGPHFTILDVRDLLDELDSQADNYGREQEVGRLCGKAHNVVAYLAAELLASGRTR